MTIKKNIADFIIKLIPSRKYKNKFLRKFLSPYDWHRAKYNLGKHSYIGETSCIENNNTVVGKYCSIAHEVLIGISQHPTDFLTTHGFAYTVAWPKLYGEIYTPREYVKNISNLNKPCKIGSDVWIGRRAIIMNGITIGDGAVVEPRAL